MTETACAQVEGPLLRSVHPTRAEREKSNDGLSVPSSRIYEPRGGALRFFRSRASRILLEGPAGTGKTSAILEKINALCDKYAGFRALICRKTRASMNETVLVTLEDILGRHHFSMRDPPARRNREVYEYANGSCVVVGGLDKPEKTFSGEYDIVAVFEAIECDENDIELLLRTLRHGKWRPSWSRGPHHALVMDTNPGPETHWLNHRDDWLERIESRHEDNPRLWDGRDWTDEGRAYIAMLDALTGHRRERLRYGRWVSAEGLVYHEFDRRVHVIDKMPDGWESWPKYRAIDFGFKDPFVCLWAAVKDDRVYVYREMYRSQRIVADHAARINELSRGESYVATIADHDAEDRATLARHGITTTPAQKDIASGLDAVRSRLRVLGDGRPSLFILRGCGVEHDGELARAKRPTSLLEEFDCYVWKRRADKTEKDEPMDRDNHALDALRYLCKHLEGRGASRFFFSAVGGGSGDKHSFRADL